MANISRAAAGFYTVLFFLLGVVGILFSLHGYLGFFSLSDIIEFSWSVGVAIFLMPGVFYLSWLAFCIFLKKPQQKMNSLVSKYLIFFTVFGVIFSFLFSIYIETTLKKQGYLICPDKVSWRSPNEYVRDIKLCQ
ncbi:DUF1240 domain-containing protein [Serratia microhaemolytica]|uniref:DUF1240 domain-containing protein n=1 Tax=Serratia microhaemolytica TaxID=2675110 RepID=UPI000FDCE8A0|nr:DUF1240 domain-containing protein [Serratia microhaemolytica]